LKPIDIGNYKKKTAYML